MTSFPQHGGCICGDVRFTLTEDPVMIYACHCTDCQTETGSTCLIAVVVRSEALEHSGAQPESHRVRMADGDDKGGNRCPRCKGPVGGGARGNGLTMVEGGAFDDTSWIEPAGHIWTRSAQPWVAIPPGALRYDAHPSDADWLSITVAWKNR